MKEEGALWRRVIEAKSDTSEKGWYAGAVTRPDGKGLWKKYWHGS